eukprot:757669-Hanusia_phi.AAC.2
MVRGGGDEMGKARIEKKEKEGKESGEEIRRAEAREEVTEQSHEIHQDTEAVKGGAGGERRIFATPDRDSWRQGSEASHRVRAMRSSLSV